MSSNSGVRSGISKYFKESVYAIMPLLIGGLGFPNLTYAQGYSYSTLYAFHGGSDGANPYAALLMDAAGNFYSTTYFGGDVDCALGPPGCGTIFKLAGNGKETLLHRFAGNPDGAIPNQGLIADKQGNGYGVTTVGGDFDNGTVFKISKTGKTSILHSFTGGADGGLPNASLIVDPSGNLLGTTYVGGNTSCTILTQPGCGVVFELDPTTGVETVLYAFNGSPGGIGPSSALTRDAGGNLYGTTYYGGTAGYGVVFKLDMHGNEQVLFSFDDVHGSGPAAPLLLESGGVLYSTTFSGGTSGLGTVFSLSKSGLKVLHSFTGGSDGANPEAGLIADLSGNLYGTTFYGGDDIACNQTHYVGCGVVYQMDRITGAETVIHTFHQGPEGANPGSALLRDAKGNLYGTALYGGDPNCQSALINGCGVVFKLTP
jgi:uncharacterized repeat protein (TIGR03803 family)